MPDLLLEKCKPLIGVVHLPPLPGSPGYRRQRYPRGLGRKWSLQDIISYAIDEASKYEKAGFDAVIIENYGDKPYKPKAGIAQAIAMTAIVREVTRSTSIPVGVNLLRNSVYEALHIAHATGAVFIRANNLCEHRVSLEGILQPAAHDLAKAISELDLYDTIENGNLTILADIDVKHSNPLTTYDTKQLVEDCIQRTGIPIAAIIVTGKSTGQPPQTEKVQEIKDIADKYGAKIFIGSGITHENLSTYWLIADGFIVGTSVKLGANTENIVSLEAVTRLAKLVEHYRKEWNCK